MTVEGHNAPLRLAVIGGGFTGAVLVMNAVRATRQPLDLTVIEPAAELGRGIAYGTRDPGHRINVPSDRMSLFKDRPSQATDWLRAHRFIEEDPDCHDGNGHFFVARAAYGRFVRDALDEVLDRASGRVRLKHRPTVVTDLRRSGRRWSVTVDDGEPIETDMVALCFGHAIPALPCRLTPEVLGNPRFVPDPWAERALGSIRPTDSVLIVGTGLTMADVVISLQHRDHRGPVTAISRRGLLPRPHGPFRNDYDLFEGEPAPRTARGLVRLLRARVRRDGAAQGWQPIIDALRFKLPVVWSGLPIAERRQVVRRLLPFWEVHRFRAAPQAEASLRRAQRSGLLTVERAGLAGLTRADGRFVARLAGRGSRVDVRRFDAVVLCTGPEKDLRRNPFIGRLLGSGVARLDDMAIGLATDARSRVLDGAGRPWPTLLAFGPMTRGTFGEMTGAPDIAAHVEAVAPLLFGDTDPPGEPRPRCSSGQPAEPALRGADADR